MKKFDRYLFALSAFITISFIVKLVLIIKYKNQLTLDSDDLNYVKSAVVMLKKGIFVFHNYNEPTVFVMPLYPLFLASVFKVFGYGIVGFQAVRVIQAVISSVTVVLVYLSAKHLFDKKTALVASFLVSFYLPNIVTVGYFLTETLFTALLCLLIYLSLRFAASPGAVKFMALGVVWAAAALVRPTIALYPLLFFSFILLCYRYDFFKVVKLGFVMAVSFIIIFTPWWIRNYMEYREFIPLAASSGNPMLQGTYINYKQTPQNIVYYKLGRNALETNKIEVETARKRISEELRKDFWGYLKWYTVGKTQLMWMTIFYWKPFFGISQYNVIAFHYVILLGFIGAFIGMFKKFSRHILPISVILYFNIVHCITMAFDRYAFPLLPILSIYSAYLLVSIFSLLERAMDTAKQR